MLGILNPFMREYKTEHESWAALNPVSSTIHTTNTTAYAIRLSFNLNYGKQFRGGRKLFENTDTESGIMQGMRE